MPLAPRPCLGIAEVDQSPSQTGRINLSLSLPARVPSPLSPHVPDNVVQFTKYPHSFFLEPLFQHLHLNLAAVCPCLPCPS